MTGTSIIDLIILTMLMFLSAGMFSVQLENRKNALIRYLGLDALLIGLAVGAFFMEMAIDVRISDDTTQEFIKNTVDFVLVILSILSTGCYKKCSWKSLAFVGAASYALTTTVTNLYSLMTVPFFGPNALISIPSGVPSTFLRIGVFTLSTVLSFAVCWFFFLRRYIRRNYPFAKYSVSNTGFLLILILFFVNIFIANNEMGSVAYALSLTGKVLATVLVLFTLFGQFNYFSLKFENSQLQTIMEHQKKQYEEAKENAEQLNIKAHDIKHIMEVFDSSSDIPKEYREQLKSITEEYENVYHTGNKALDTAITDKCRDFDHLGISFSVIADGASLSFMKDVDVFILFSNILSNSKEAVLPLANPKDRIISLYVKKEDHRISIHCDNTFAKKPLLRKGEIVTTKEDNVNHGYGLKSIEAIVRQYKGNVKVSISEKIFSLDILFFENSPSTKGENTTD